MEGRKREAFDLSQVGPCSLAELALKRGVIATTWIVEYACAGGEERGGERAKEAGAGGRWELQRLWL